MPAKRRGSPGSVSTTSAEPRHLYVRSGTPERVATDVLGHRRRFIFDRYKITSEDDLREPAGGVDREPVGEALGNHEEKTPETSL